MAGCLPCHQYSELLQHCTNPNVSTAIQRLPSRQWQRGNRSPHPFMKTTTPYGPGVIGSVRRWNKTRDQANKKKAATIRPFSRQSGRYELLSFVYHRGPLEVNGKAVGQAAAGALPAPITAQDLLREAKGGSEKGGPRSVPPMWPSVHRSS